MNSAQRRIFDHHVDFKSILKQLKATNDMKKHLIEYKNLMNVKLSLEKEIDVYRSLLEGISSLNSFPASFLSLDFR